MAKGGHNQIQTEIAFSEQAPNRISHNKNILLGLNIVKPLKYIMHNIEHIFHMVLIERTIQIYIYRLELELPHTSTL